MLFLKDFLIAYISNLTTSFDEIINPIFHFITSALGGNPKEGIIGSLKCILKKMIVSFIKKYIYDILAGAKGFGLQKQLEYDDKKLFFLNVNFYKYDM